MSDSIISFVPKKIEYENSIELADLLVKRMQDKGYISDQQKDNVLSSGLGYCPGVNYRKILENEDNKNQVEALITNGVEIVFKRKIFHGYGNGLDEVMCPNCKSNIIESNWAEIVDNWYKGGSKHMICPNCKVQKVISEYIFSMEKEFYWAFSNLGISFYNWPPFFKKEFVKELEEIFKEQITIVYARL